MTGPGSDRWINLCAWVLIIGLYTAFITQVAPNIWVDYTVYVFSSMALFVFTILSLLLTSFTEPGIIPRKSIQLALEGKVLFPFNIGDVTYD